MAQSQQSIESIIKNSFALQVAVRCTEDAEAICEKNKLSFAELLRPFSQLSAQVQLKDVQGHSYTLRGVRVRFSEPQLESIPDNKLRMLLSNVVQRVTGGRDGKLGPWIQFGDITTLASTPWYDQYRDTYMEHLRQSDHECIRHYVSVLLVVPTNNPSPLEAFSQLYTKQKESEQSKYPKWLTPHLLYYHVLLHDVAEGNSTQAHNNFEKIKATFGVGCCHLLQVNSRTVGTPTEGIPDPWSQFVSLQHVADGDEVDGPSGMKFRGGSKSKKEKGPKGKSPKKEDSNLPNNVSLGRQEDVSSPQIIAPNVREEAKLVNSDEDSNGSLPDLNQSPTSEVEPGNDPLTQLASELERPDSATELKSTTRAPQGSTNFKPPSVGQCLTLEDHNTLRSFVQEFVCLRLLPHLEAVLRNLNEWLVSRRSVRRNIASMGNKFLKMIGVGGPQVNSAIAEEQSFAFNSMELQTRQLGDLAFLLQNYDLAFQTYHSVKKDFQGSSAWMHYAGAVEMCGLSVYLLSSTRREVISYLEEAISIYNITCKTLNFGVRVSLFLCEVLKERGQYRDLTQLYIRMTSEEADMRSAICLEQAAHAFLRIQPSFSRKYALHLILAGHRYAKSVQRVHSTRVYRHALAVYCDKGWTLAEDYIHFSLARHSFSLHRLLDAKLAFEHLLSHESAQAPPQQLLNLKEYIFVHKQLLSSGGESSQQIHLEQQKTTQMSAETIQSVPILPLPFVRSHFTRVIFATGASPQSLEQLDVGLKKQDGVQTSPVVTTDSKTWDNRDLNIITDNRGHKDNMKHPLMNISEQFRCSTRGGGDSLIIGAGDYNPSRCSGSKKEWEALEKRAVAGIRGVIRENFNPSVLVMDHDTDNSHIPLCVVNEPVAVGFLLKNPLKIHLHMTQISLSWNFTSRSNEDSALAGASCEVVERCVLLPEEQKMLTLHITPLKEGDLEVLGFVYNLCVDTTQLKGSESPIQTSIRTNLPSLSFSSRDSLYQKHQSRGVQEILAEGVQGKVEIRIQGPRMNNTKVEKSSVAYGRDYRLHWSVTSPMPKLVASISGLSKQLLSGEVCRLGLEVFNCGQVALNSLRITSNLSQQLLLDEKPGSKGSIYTSSPPSSTQPSHIHPHTPSQCIELPLPRGRLESGEGISVSLLLQGLGGGEVPWNLVLYYEPALITASSRISHRVLRHSCGLRMRDSLHIRSSSIHGHLPSGTNSGSRFDINQLIITLEFENKCQIVESSAVELRVMQISCVSRRWTIERADDEQGTICLLPSEGGLVLLKASQVDSVEDKLCFSDVPLGQSTFQSSQFPAADLFFGSEAFRALCPPRQVVGARESRLEAAQAEEIALVIFWQALMPGGGGTGTLFTYGHHTVTVPMPQSMAALTEAHPSLPLSPYDLVKYHLVHPVSYHHDFTNSLCQIPVHITLQNCSPSNLQAVLELPHPKEGIQDGSKSPGKHPHSHSHSHSHSHTHQELNCIWTGGMCRRHITLEAHSTKTITVYVHFSRPGVYNLSHIRVLAAQGDGNYHIQRWQRTSFITVE